MKCSVFIATSADGYIATKEGNIDWLQTAGKAAADMSENPDMGFNEFISSVDCMIMGRKCMEVIASFNLTDEQWPYRDLKIIVLSNTLSEPPTSLLGKVDIYAGDIDLLLKQLEADGFKHAYIDGGTTITSFINLQLVNEMIITQAPILLGQGLPLFGDISETVKLHNTETKVFANDFIQTKYSLNYSNHAQ